ncbi:altronate oxidoreductase [Gemmatimonadetes bacterium T265]|nr:altronate oxidoreductase [Gemmatimonadetes bacterium T265]
MSVSVRPRLTRALAESAAFRARTDLAPPPPAFADLPERALQFGTGALLRGLVVDALDQANRRGAFNGRVVVVGSTGSGRERAFTDQDGLYTLAVQGTVDGRPVRALRVVGAVSRALSADDDWDAVLACARDPLLSLIFSNTTEVGLALDPDPRADAADARAPRSFPAKLARVLLERARAFACAPSAGLAVVPCELVEHNGDTLRALVLDLAARWRAGDDFARWAERHVDFCNTLVDRIVPGAPAGAAADALAAATGYDDMLLTTCEPYHLFAIEGDDARRTRLGFVADGDESVFVTPDVGSLRERKVRLLNGTHTATAPLALLAGCETVREAVRDARLGPYVRRLLFDEIAPTLAQPGVDAYASAVLDRFDNGAIRHALWDITLQGTTKLRVRLTPTIQRYTAAYGRAPAALTLGLAAHLWFLRGALHDARRRAGLAVPPDDQGAAVRAHWDATGGRPTNDALRAVAHATCADRALWGENLAALPRVADAVAAHLTLLRDGGAAAALDALAPAVA